MAGKIDLLRLKTQVEAAMETLLRAADERVSWKQSPHQHQFVHMETTPSSDSGSGTSAPYALIPGVYCSSPPGGGAATTHENDSDSAHPSPTTALHTNTELNDGELRVVLHGDNTFEYTWTMKRSGVRAMEFCVEMTGSWNKPVLNRSRRGDEDQRVFLHVKRMRFQRLSNYDAASGTWKLCLKTLTRHGSDWAVVGETERGVPPIVIALSCGTAVGAQGNNNKNNSATLESTGAAQASQVLSNSPACRVLAGLTKKIANKLGAPIDVMTDRWLPARHMVLVRLPDEQRNVRAFNPFFCLAEALLQQKQQPPQPTQLQPEQDEIAPLPVSA